MFVINTNSEIKIPPLLLNKVTGKYIENVHFPTLWEENIRIDLKEISINTRNSVDSAQDMAYWKTLVNAALNLRDP